MSPAGTLRAQRARTHRQGAGAPWRELRNKLEAFRLVRFGGLHEAPTTSSLAERVAAVYRRGPATAAFRLERVAYELVNAAWRRDGEPPRHLLNSDASSSVPQGSLILLHTGMGMAFADRLLRPLSAASPASAFDAALRRFLELCRLNSRAGYGSVPVEALGLMVRMFLPRLRFAVERQLRSIDGEQVHYFWHGAGRAIYFLPAQFVPFPGSCRRAVEACRRQPSDPELRLDALSGLCFAVAMINLRQPAILERYLDHVAGSPAEAEAFASGVAACLIARHDTAPEDPAIADFLSYTPRTADRRRLELWERWGHAPAAAALARLYPQLKSRGALELLARHRPLPALTRWLEQDEAVGAGGEI